MKSAQNIEIFNERSLNILSKNEESERVINWVFQL